MKFSLQTFVACGVFLGSGSAWAFDSWACGQGAADCEGLEAAHTAGHGQVKHYNLEAILAVGFRVRSKRGTQFRRWANAQLQEFLVKGFVILH